MKHPTYLSIADLQERYNIRHHNTATKLAHEIGGIKAGGKWLINLEDVEAWEQSSTKSPYRSRHIDEGQADGGEGEVAT